MMNWQRILTINPTERIQFWSKPFTAHSITYSISESLTEKELETICVQIRYLAGNHRNENLHFVIFFPDNAGALFVAPKRGLCCDMTKESIPEPFKQAKNRIAEAARTVISDLQKPIANNQPPKASLSWNK